MTTTLDDLPSLLKRERFTVSCDKPKDLEKASSFVYEVPKRVLKPGEVQCNSCTRVALPGMSRCATCRSRERNNNAREHAKRQERLNAARQEQKQCLGCPKWMAKESPDRCPRCVALNEQRLANQQAKAEAWKMRQAERGKPSLAPGLKKCHACGVGIAEDGPTRCRPCADKQNAKRKKAKAE
jgi:hypothetical protein